MSLLTAVAPIINSRTAKVVLEVSANTKAEGELVVVAKPIVGPVASNAPEALKLLCSALATPIKAIGTPDTIEAELAALVSEQAPQRNAWATQAAALNSQIEQASKTDASKGTAKKDTTPAASAPKDAATAETAPASEPQASDASGELEPELDLDL